MVDGEGDFLGAAVEIDDALVENAGHPSDRVGAAVFVVYGLRRRRM